MKKLFTILAFVAGSAIAYAQPGSGSIYAGGGINFSSASEEEDDGNTVTKGPKTSNFGINLMGGYFITDNISAGLGIGFNSNSTKTDLGNGNSISVSSSGFGITPFARYHNFLSDNFGLFGQFEIGIGSGNSKTETVNGSTTTKTETPNSYLGIGIRPGIQFFVTDHISLESTFGFIGIMNNSSGTTDNGGTKTSFSSFAFNLNTTTAPFNLGFNYFF